MSKLTRKNISVQDGPYYVPKYQIFRDGVMVGTATKTGTHLDNYPWDWEAGERSGHTGLLSEAMQDIEDAI